MKFKIESHSVRLGVQVVAVFDDEGNFIAQICPGDSDQDIRVFSKYTLGATIDNLSSAVPIVVINLAPAVRGYRSNDA